MSDPPPPILRFAPLAIVLPDSPRPPTTRAYSTLKQLGGSIEGCMADKPKSHIVYRDPDSGQLISRKDGERRNPDNVTRERMPNPGHGDTGRYDKK